MLTNGLTEITTMPKPKKELISVKISPEVYRLVKTAAAWLGEDIADYLSRVVEPIAKRDVEAIACQQSKKGRRADSPATAG